MITYYILGLFLVMGLFLVARWFVSAEPKEVARAARWVLIVIGTMAVVYLVLLRRFGLALWLIVMLLPLVLRWRAVLQRLKASAGPSPGRSSTIETRFLRMVLDHDSGAMGGEVLEGRFIGRRLEDLAPEQLVELWRDWRAADAQSAAVLEAYLDRTLGQDWRAAAGAGAGEGSGGGGSRPGSAETAMTREEAYKILGLEPGADAEQIRQAHRQLMQKVHPDHGGSNYLAAKINQAKDLLLGR